MRNSLFVVVAILFLGLVAGAGLTASSSPIPFTEQVDNPEASTLVGTENQYQVLALVVVVTLGSLGGLGTGLAILVYFLNRQVVTLEEGEAQPFNFSLQADGHSIGAVFQQNAFLVSIAVGLALVLLLIVLVIISGAVF